MKNTQFKKVVENAEKFALIVSAPILVVSFSLLAYMIIFMR